MATPSQATFESQLSVYSDRAVSRYQNGYKAAQAISGLGSFCKFIGFVAGIFVVFFGVMGSATVMRPNPDLISIASYQTQHNIYLISVIFFGALVASAGWVIGALITGYSEGLRATIDEAVHTSPFLGNAQRAQVMHLT
jgi:hypothetical protein